MKPGLQYVLEKTYRAEGAVIVHLEALMQRHPAEHEVRHVAIDLLRLSRSNREHLAAAVAEHELDLRPLDEESERHDATVQGTGVDPGTPLGLLEDFRELFLRASGTSLDWEMLGSPSTPRPPTRPGCWTWLRSATPRPSARSPGPTPCSRRPRRRRWRRRSGRGAQALTDGQLITRPNFYGAEETLTDLR